MERYDFRTQRLFVEESLAVDGSVRTDRAQANYLLNVLRLRGGSNVLLFNGRDGEWLAEVKPEGRKACRLVLVEQTRPQPSASDLVYLYAPLKQARLDYMIQKAVEMGVGSLQPVITQHTQVAKLKQDRIRANIIEAAEQCGILNLPSAAQPERLIDLLEHWNTGRRIIFCDERDSQMDALEILETIMPGPLAVLIGPEGGFSTSERELLNSLEFVTSIPLGPRILRADTAAVAALALVQATLGDWRGHS